MKSDIKTMRSEGKTQISISISEDLLMRLDRMAMNDNRNRSNYISNALQVIVEQAEKQMKTDQSSTDGHT